MSSGKWDHDKWLDFKNFREDFKNSCENWKNECDSLLREKLLPLISSNAGPYTLENTIVYNTDLDKITEGDEIKLILIGDNPGKNEQKDCNKKYLCGLSGKLCENFFKSNPELETDFRKNVIILNKTPVHTARTALLKDLSKSDPKIAQIIKDSQIYMAKKTAALQKKLGCKIWLIGYSELKKNGIFSEYTNTLKEECDLENLFVYQHFSMSRFSIDLRDFEKTLSGDENKSLSLTEKLDILGTEHRKRFFDLNF